jgi:hypothetical protein
MRDEASFRAAFFVLFFSKKRTIEDFLLSYSGRIKKTFVFKTK